MKTLKESLFDTNLANKKPWFEWVKKYDIQTLFREIMNLLGPYCDKTIDWMEDQYTNHEFDYNFLCEQLNEAFKKQHFNSWINIDESSFEDLGNEMTEDEIEQADQELMKFFKDAKTDFWGGYFMIYKNKKIPDFILNILKASPEYTDKIKNIKTWAIEYHTDIQGMNFYGCPKDLDPTVKKLLYDC